jgi:hypothetical protein
MRTVRKIHAVHQFFADGARQVTDLLLEGHRFGSRPVVIGHTQDKNYLAGHSGRMNYKQIAARGWPIGSGPVESSCRQDQCRFKRPGQSWTGSGFLNLSALDEARRNNHWDELWVSA